MILNRKIKRNIKIHKTTYIVAIALLILSTGLFTMFNIGGPVIKDSIKNFKDDYKVEDAYFTTALPISDMQPLENMFDLNIEKMEWKDVKVLDKVTLRIYKERKNINLVQITEGEALSKSKDIVINNDFYLKNNKNIGDSIDINGEEYNLNGKSATPDYIYMLENNTSLFSNKETFGVAFISEEDFKEIDSPSIGYSIRLNKDNESEFKEYIKENYFALSWVERKNNTKINAIDGDINGMFALGQYLPIVVVVLVSLLISIVIWRLVKNELTELGTLYAFGYTKATLTKHYMVYPILVSLIGALLGQIPGVMLANSIKAALSVEYNLPIIIVDPDIKIIVLSILIPIIIIAPINFIVISRALNHSAVDLMKGKLKEEGPSFLERKIPLKGLSFSMKYKIKEVLRNLWRTALTISAIVFSAMLLFFVFVMNDSMERIVKQGYEDSYKFDNLYMLSNMSIENRGGEKFWNLPVMSSNNNDEEIKYTLEAREKDSTLLVLKDAEGEVLSFDKNIVSKSLAKKLGVKEGDTLKLKSELEDSTFEIEIEKIANSFLGDKLYISLETLYRETEIPKDSYIGIVSKEKIEFQEGQLASSTSKTAMVDGIKSMISPLKFIMWMIGVIAALIGIALIYVIITMVIDENRLNISMFKIMGYDDKRLSKTILNINDILIVFGYLISIPLSKVAISAMFAEVTKDMEFSLQAIISPLSMLIVLIILETMYTLTKAISKRKILSIPMDEVLKNGRE
ncbi:FtsX-like permease family protein [Clostridium vincentii]|uniref:FtsX-like permease family protein n=1 Tax=Clostridium vincentii TaxID=52704 RepID=A0A2T0BD65_9CLOT|nr:FtsX-like permease family protein [Clostridium vincentii]PRR81831.1 FtsX-like permease family protein [Clostridium vincentii]